MGYIGGITHLITKLLLTSWDIQVGVKTENGWKKGQVGEVSVASYSIKIQARSPTSTTLPAKSEPRNKNKDLIYWMSCWYLVNRL